MTIAVKFGVCGVGINDADYPIQHKIELPKVNGKRRQKVVWTCPYYKRWCNLLYRCYSKKSLRESPTYEDCIVCDEWLTLSNFKTWMEKQDWKGNHLDKDILFPGNKIYSPETCVFVSAAVNSFITERGNERGDFLIGVCSYKDRTSKHRGFLSYCASLNGQSAYLGNFSTELEAHQAWLREKLHLAQILASQQTDPRVGEALVSRYKNYRVLNDDSY